MKYSSWNSVASYLVENIKKKIENGEYGEGSKLPSEKMLSEEYSVGRSSVREALKMLQAENLIEIVKGKGSFVLSTDARSKGIDQWYHSKKEVFRDLVEIRVALECLAVKKAAVKNTAAVIREKRLCISFRPIPEKASPAFFYCMASSASLCLFTAQGLRQSA